MTKTAADRPSGWLLRHAQSLSNTGVPGDPRLTPLSPVGQQQAAWVANRLNSAFPATSSRRLSLIVTSDLPRTQQTIAPLLALQPDLSQRVWEIHELVNLPNELAYNTDYSQRQSFIEQFWQRANPYAGGDGTERFIDFIDRIDLTIERLKSEGQPRMILCGHGIFLTALRWRLLVFPLLSGEERSNPVAFMKDFGQYLAKNMWKNSVLRPFSVNSSGFVRIKKAIKPPSFPHRPMIKDERNRGMVHMIGQYD